MSDENRTSRNAVLIRPPSNRALAAAIEILTQRADLEGDELRRLRLREVVQWMEELRKAVPDGRT